MSDRKPTASTLTLHVSTSEATALSPALHAGDLGRQIGGQFVLKRELGRGGFGTAYLADQMRSGSHVPWRDVVVKISSFTLREAGRARRFTREAAVLAKLDNHHLVKVFAFGELPDDRLFIAMEFGGEETLADLLHRERKLPWRRALLLCAQICEALEEAARWKVVHRDLKPANILVSRREGQDWVKVVDFGIARIVEELSEARAGTLSSAPTQTADFIGTPSYASPEQALGHVVDARSDIYSLGIVLYEMLSSHRPFAKSSVESMLEAQAHEPAAPLAQHELDAPPEVERVVMRALAKSPVDRFASAAELRAAIEHILAGQEGLPPPPRTPRWRLVATGVVVAALFAVIASWAFRAPTRATPIATPPAAVPQVEQAHRLLLHLTDDAYRVSGTGLQLAGGTATLSLGDTSTFRIDAASGDWHIDGQVQRTGVAVRLSFSGQPKTATLADGVVLGAAEGVDVGGEPRRLLLRADDGRELVVLVRVER